MHVRVLIVFMMAFGLDVGLKYEMFLMDGWMDGWMEGWKNGWVVG